VNTCSRIDFLHLSVGQFECSIYNMNVQTAYTSLIDGYTLRSGRQSFKIADNNSRSSKSEGMERSCRLPVQPEHMRQASLFSIEHRSLASSSSRCFCLSSAAAYSGSTSFSPLVAGAAEAPRLAPFDVDGAEDEVVGVVGVRIPLPSCRGAKPLEEGKPLDTLGAAAAGSGTGGEARGAWFASLAFWRMDWSTVN
jgi:hypothetical protein